MITPRQFKKGAYIKLDGDIYEVVDYSHCAMGNKRGFVKTKMKSLTTGLAAEKTLRSDERLEDVFMDEKDYQFLYVSGGEYHFMDQKTFEQAVMDKSHLEDVIPYLKENMAVKAYLNEGKVVNISPPLTVELAVTSTEPGVRGDTAKGGSKPAVLETGLTVQVPLFINNGDVVKVDTRSGSYTGRA